jgi:glycosyl hydrolase family 123
VSSGVHLFAGDYDDRATVAARRQPALRNIRNHIQDAVARALLSGSAMKQLVVVTAVAFASTQALAQSVWVAPSTQKVRPADASGAATSATLEAARNELEAFHVVVYGGAGGAKAITVAAPSLTGPGGAVIDDVRVFREAWYTTTAASYASTAVGRWPDAMIPAVDEIDNQPRNAFPWDVPANEQQPIWVEYHVPAGAPAGWYTGVVHVTGGVTADVPVKLYVHAFALPSTASVRTAFGIGYNDPCVAHYGGYTQCGSDAGVQTMLGKYARLALDHRISLSDIVSTNPTQKADGSWDWTQFDALYAPFMDGGVGGRLAGAKLTSLRYIWTVDQAHFAAWAAHFRARGWLDRAFDYTCDEPPSGCAWTAIPTRAAQVHGGDAQFETLVTTPIARATSNSVLGSIDTLVAGTIYLDPPAPDVPTRQSYDAWLGQSAQHRVWLYQSCETHGCSTPGSVGYAGYMIDAPAANNRALEWQAWRQKVSGELYYDTTYAFTRGDAWTTQYYFGGNGDGNLFYPGTPAKIGGTSHVPIASLRMKLIRDGQEDYEYLKLLADAGDPAMADAEAAALSPHAYQNELDPAKIDASRHRMALRIEQLTGQTPPTMGGGGSGGGGGGGNTSGGSGGNGAAPPTTGAPGPAPSSHLGCSAVHGRRPLVTPFSVALVAALGFALARRRGLRD